MHLRPSLISLKCTTAKTKKLDGPSPVWQRACLSGWWTPLTKFSSRMKRERLQQMHSIPIEYLMHIQLIVCIAFQYEFKYKMYIVQYTTTTLSTTTTNTNIKTSKNTITNTITTTTNMIFIALVKGVS